MFKTLCGAAAALCLFVSLATAQVQAPVGDCCQKECNQVCCDACCCDSSAWFVEFEATFLRYHRANGLRAGFLGPDPNAGDSFADPAFEFAPRITIGRVDCNGLGYRVSYWDYELEETSVDGDDRLEVETYTIDFEVFRRYDLSCDHSLELHAGFRYNDFREIIREGSATIDQDSRFDGLGLITGFEARQCWWNGELYASSSLAILAGDQNVFDDGNSDDDEARPDSILGVIELAAGYESCHPRANGGAWVWNVGVEYQLWMNYVGHRNNNDNPIGNSDVGFVGFVIGGGLVY